MSKKKKNNNITIQDWAGNILFKGHYKDKKVAKVLEANKCIWCKDENDIEGCSSCDDTGYSGDFEIYWDKLADHKNENVYEFINY